MWQLNKLADGEAPKHERMRALTTFAAGFPVVEGWGERIHELFLYVVAVRAT